MKSNPKIIAVLRANDASDYREVMEVLISEGITALELTLTTPNTLDELPKLVEYFGKDASVGVGTVLSKRDAQRAFEGAAKFLVSPNVEEEVVRFAVQKGIPMYAGALTPTEVQRAISLGASAVKVFPAQTVGAEYLSHLKGPFPELKAIPSGGIDLDGAREWLRRGAFAVSVGGPLIGSVFEDHDLNALRVKARDFVSAIEHE